MIAKVSHALRLAGLLLALHPAALALAAQPAQSAEAAAIAPAADPGWPRSFTHQGNTVVVYQPQIDSWDNHATIHFRSAVVATPAGSEQPAYGVVAIAADTLVDSNAGTVIMTNLKPDIRFPDAPADQQAALTGMVNELMTSRGVLNIALSRVLAYMHGQPPERVADVSLAPPPIHYSDVPAILVIFMGPPQFEPVPGTSLQFAVNTNWPVLQAPDLGQNFLLAGDSWLVAPDPLLGPWTAAGTLPAELTTLPDAGNWQSVFDHIPGTPFSTVPAVVTSSGPAELIVTDGPPAYTPIAGTRLMAVSNSEQTLFQDLANGQMYFLVAGRWFSAPTLAGPWSAASATLPAEFAKIPPDGPQGAVLASVPGTSEAEDAALLAAVPHKATVTIANATLDVSYQGQPQFVPVVGTSMQYAVNTAYEVVLVQGQYYCCYQGVWFVAPTATGAWTVALSLPPDIATIPASCPLYNVTYVQIYDSSPTTVVTGCTGGYYGEYVATNGALMFGAGLAVGAFIADNACWYPCTPCYYSYGCAARYDTAAGCYCRGAQYYGPQGGAGWGAAYNPATGNWSRAAYAYGPAGSATVRQAYNPYTNTFASHATASNGYQSWGHSVVQQGNQWAAAGHETGAAGVSQGWVETSSGQSAYGARGSQGNAVATTSNGDLYASHDGNVYKNTGNGWQVHQDGGWQDAPSARPPANTAWNSHAGGTTSGGDTIGSWSGGAAAGSRPVAWGGATGTPGTVGGAWGSAGSAGLSTAGQGFAQGGMQSAAQNPWANHDTQSRLNGDAWARGAGNGGFGGFGGGQVGGFGGGARFGGGGFRR